MKKTYLITCLILTSAHSISADKAIMLPADHIMHDARTHYFFTCLKGAYEHLAGAHSAATSTYQRLNKVLINDPALMHASLHLAFAKKEYATILAHASVIDPAKEEQKESAFLLAQTYLMHDMNDEAAALFEKLMAHYPTENRFEYFATIAYGKTNEHEKAHAVIDRALKKNELAGKHHLFHFLKAKLHYTKDTAAAYAAAQQCITCNPLFAKGFFLLGSLEEQQKNTAAALTAYERYHRLAPEDKTILDKIQELRSHS